ncbi:MAG: hypothetical protein IJY38_00900 [Clostridia bacterium]|nr:hypothetical protein [Clostridia bacterium]
MKKFLAMFCATAMLATGVATLSGCSEDGGTVMNVSLNPEVEFVLDEENKVISVNALNEEGNLIISSATFTGKSADEAVELFVQVSDETGFLFKGEVQAGENEVSVSFSGNSSKAKSLYQSVENKVKAYFESADIEGKIEKGKAISKEYLQSLVAECAPYIDAAKVEALSYMELVEEIAQSRQETAEFYSQEVKNAYYEAKAFAMQQAEVEAIKEHLNVAAKAACDFAFGVYEGIVNTIESTRLTMLVNENSPYQVALRAFQAAKVEYLNYRNYVASLEQNEVTTQISTTLANYQTVLDNAETALVNAGQTANETLDGFKAQATTAYQSVIDAIGNYSKLVNDNADQISAKVTEAKNKFFTDFETGYQANIDGAKQAWADMKAQLQAE